jgi:DNA-binding CsgD family transcriptional regulator
MGENGVVVGRDRELEVASSFVGDLGAGSVTLLVEGAAGVGKTTIWGAALVEARRRGVRVLRARPTEFESHMSFAGLDDLLAGVIDEVLPSLSEPQRHALEVVLLRAAPRGAEIDERTVGRAVLESLRLLSVSCPLAVAVDDVQWLDPPTARTLGFVQRRLTSESVGVLLAWRSVEGAALPLGLDRAPDPTHVRRLQVEPLSVGALHDVIELHLGVSLSRSVVVRVHEVSAGNPFYGLEIARALAGDDGALRAAEPLPIPASLSMLVQRRISQLPEFARDVLVFVAALSHPTASMVEAAVGRRALDAIERAQRGEVVLVHGERLEFSHPLLAAAVYSDASPQRRRTVHRRLAEVVTDPEEQARHLGLGTVVPDGEVAAKLDAAAELAFTRGAPLMAGELYDEARRLTPDLDVEGGLRRCLAAAKCYAIAGDVRRGRERADQVLSAAPPGWQRAEALALPELSPGPRAWIALLDEALVNAEGRTELCARILTLKAHGEIGALDPRAALNTASRALAVAEETGDARMISGALVAAGRADLLCGGRRWVDLLPRAVALEEQHLLGGMRAASLPSGWLADMLRWTDEFDSARVRLAPLLHRANEQGDDLSAGELLYDLAELELWAGNWQLAFDYARESVEVNTRAEQDWDLTGALGVCAAVQAHLGLVDEARANAGAGVALSRSLEAADELARNLCALGFLELSLSRPAAAVDALAEVAELTAAVAEPGVLRCAGDHIEALIALGQLEEADTRLQRLEQQGRALRRVWALAVAGRCRGLLMAAHGELAAAINQIDAARADHALLAMPFEQGRTLLTLGMTQRRARRNREARQSLTAASEIFDRLGAPLWSAKAAGELRRIGGRRRPPHTLTVTEQRIATLVAGGASNPEVAAELFMSRRTVEDHLSKIYRKLGVRSRTELAHHLMSEQPATNR